MISRRICVHHFPIVDRNVACWAWLGHLPRRSSIDERQELPRKYRKKVLLARHSALLQTRQCHATYIMEMPGGTRFPNEAGICVLTWCCEPVPGLWITLTVKWYAVWLNGLQKEKFLYGLLLSLVEI